MTPNQKEVLINWLHAMYPDATGIEIESIDPAHSVKFTYEDKNDNSIFEEVFATFHAVGDTLEDVKINGLWPPRYDSPVSEDNGDLMTVEEFKGFCANDSFIDYDGYGYAVINGMADRMNPILPSEASKIRSNVTHVIWFNR